MNRQTLLEIHEAAANNCAMTFILSYTAPTYLCEAHMQIFPLLLVLENQINSPNRV